MPRFLIEVPHSAETRACARVIQVFLSTGSHYLTNADWGCGDGVHKAWMVVEVADKAEALGIVPPAFRADATVVRLSRFTLAQIERTLARHAPAGGESGGGGGGVG
jgi:hypothetical protein